MPINGKSEDIVQEISFYKHKYNGTVKFEDVGPLGFVHQNKYLSWIEAARIDYYRDICPEISHDITSPKFLRVMAKISIEYFDNIRFLDNYQILSRIDYLGRASATFNHIVKNIEEDIIAKEKAILVFIDPKKRKPRKIPELFRSAVLEYEVKVKL